MKRLLVLIVALALFAAFPVVSASATPDAKRLPDNARYVGDGLYSIPLSAPQPSWYTPRLHQRVRAAAERGQGVALPSDIRAEYQASGLLFTGIRPGAWMIAPSGCTMMWVFGNVPGTTTSQPAAEKMAAKGRPIGGKRRSGSGVYIGTVGHCTEVGDEVTLVALPGVLMNIGRTVKSVDGLGNDYAFVEVRPEMVQYVNPSMTHFGGPTGSQPPAFGDPIVHSGHGVVIGTGGTPRAGVVTYDEGPNGDFYGWDGAAIFGDSGSAVRHATGAAAGNLTHLVVGGKYLPAFIGGTTIQKILAVAPAPLATAPPIPDPLW